MKMNRNTSQSTLNNAIGYRQWLLYPLALTLLMCVGLLLILSPDVTTAQPLPPPSASMTASPLPPTLSPTPSNTPTPDVTLSSLMQRRVVIHQGNSASLETFYRWQGHHEEVSSLIFTSPDALFSTALNSTYSFPAVRLWQIQTTNVNPVRGESENVGADTISRISRSKDGRLAMIGHGGAAEILDAITGRPIARIPQTWASTIATDGGYGFIVSGENHVVGIWANVLPYGYLESTPPPEISPLVFYSGQLVTAFLVDKPVIQVDYDGMVNRYFILTKDGVLHLYFTQDYVQSTLTTISQDAQSSATEEISSTGNLMALQADQSRVIYAGSHWDVIAYDYVQNQTVARYPLENAVSCIAIQPQSHLLLVGDRSGALSILHLDDFKLITQINIGGIISACAINDDSTLIATSDDEGHLTLWGVR